MTMNYLMQLTQDIEVLQAAILHDTVEDTSVTFEDIDRTFGARVAALVEAETENKRHGVPASQTWDIRKKETIEHLKNRPFRRKSNCFGGQDCEFRIYHKRVAPPGR